MLDALLIHYILSIFLKDRFTIELLLFRIIEIRVTLNDYSLLISFSQLVGQLLHLQDRVDLLATLVIWWEVPEHVLLVVPAINDTPEVETLGPHTHLAVLRDGDQAAQLVPVDLLDTFAMCDALPDN